VADGWAATPRGAHRIVRDISPICLRQGQSIAMLDNTRELIPLPRHGDGVRRDEAPADHDQPGAEAKRFPAAPLPPNRVFHMLWMTLWMGVEGWPLLLADR
jgi:hypothetical protein